MEEENESGRHVMYCLGMSRVVIENGEIVEVGEPVIKHCPLFKKYRNIDEINVDTVRENIQFRMDTFGMCCSNRETRMKNFLSFGISEILSSSLQNGLIDAAVIGSDGCGTVVITDPEIVQGLGGRISGIAETSPIQAVIDAVGSDNILDAKTTPLNQVKGAELAYNLGYKSIAVTVAFPEDALQLREKYGKNIIIIAVHTTGVSKEGASIYFDNADIITSCASKYLREESKMRDVVVAGNKVPVYGVTEKGKELVLMKLKEVNKEEWKGSPPEEPPFPLL